jgi:hypothetical protein
MGLQFGLSKEQQGKMWLAAREAAVMDAYYSAKLYAEVRFFSLAESLNLSCAAMAWHVLSTGFGL